MIELATAYRGVRIRVGDLVRDPGTWDVVAPTTPEWTVNDVVAHLGGITADIVSGNLDGVGTDAWANAQVDARRDREMSALLAEWDECATTVEHEAGATVCGASPSSTTLRVSRFEFTRAATGRRSSDQIAAYDWIGDARADLLVGAPFTMRSTALVE